MYENSHKRRKTEEDYQGIKQNTNLKKSPLKIFCSQRNHILASLLASCEFEFLTPSQSLCFKIQLILKANQMAYQEP
ncbi:hypothetical protein NEOC84_001668|nr:hypothetical protein [Neochlamydia sp. AcF95]NGY95743.1 hypothetical protein [Neochlamydia sp. AcF84]